MVATGEQAMFEWWAKEHKFRLEWDKDMGIYASPFTQGHGWHFRRGTG